MITGKTLITGVIGNPIQHSLSPIMHNSAYKDMDMDYKYVAFHVQPENLKNVVTAAKTFNIQGLNVTIPYKTDIIKYLDEIDPTAKKINAVNTLQFRNGIVKGYNTDGMGAIKAIENHTDIKDKNILVLGSGGASKAIVFTLTTKNPSTITIANRTQENAQKLINNINKEADFYNTSYQPINETNDIINDMDIIINTTPIGMYPNENQNPPINTEKINSKHTVMDIIYNPLETQLLKKSKSNGAQTIPGTEMFINQGIESYKIFTGKTPTYESFEKPLLKQLTK